MNASKYMDQFLALEEQAKSEIIELLKNNPKGRFIQPNEHHEDEDLWEWEGSFTYTGDCECIMLTAVGLHDDGELKFRAIYPRGSYYNDYEWFTLDEFTYPFCELYEFVVNNLDKADQEPFEFPDADEENE